jgi:uncharacterized protein (DUF1015 family)
VSRIAEQPTTSCAMTADGPRGFRGCRSPTRYHCPPVPTLRPFRALRYDSASAGDLSALVCPPYDVIDPPRREALAARDPHNAVHLELPVVEPGEPDDERYRRAARTLASWRSAGVLRKDPRPSLYILEQAYHLDDQGPTRTQRGVVARLGLEEPGPDAGVLRHERTLDAPKEDRYRLLRATGLNTSPVVGIHRSDGSFGRFIDELANGEPTSVAVDDDGVTHRLWAVPVDESDPDGLPAALLSGVSGPVVIADGHHRYETALRYRDERERACESDPPFDYVMALLFDVATEELTILPTHRLLRDGHGPESIAAALAPYFELDRVGTADELLRRLADPAPIDGSGSGTGRLGLWADGEGAVLRARTDALAPFLSRLPPELRGVDSARLAVVLERVRGVDAAASRAGERLAYTKDARAAVEAVASGDASAAFLLDPTPVEAVIAVARAGQVMPQKSTYFHPKVATGLLFNPHES